MVIQLETTLVALGGDVQVLINVVKRSVVQLILIGIAIASDHALHGRGNTRACGLESGFTVECLAGCDFGRVAIFTD